MVQVRVRFNSLVFAVLLLYLNNLFGVQEAKKKQKQAQLRSYYQRSPKVRPGSKPEAVDSDSSKEEGSEGHLSPSTPNSRKKGS